MKKYYNKLDIIRIISCIGVFLYHLNILKGGYLAVCTFFTLTGYLSYIQAEKEEKFSIRKYYLNRLKQIYYPLLIIVFLSISILLLFTNYNWINLKPETLSILLGYNNYWQLNANLDYFTRHISSPFMHFWYISILIQFELLFPFIYIILRKIKEKIHRIIPLLLLIIINLISIYILFVIGKKEDIMVIYYNSIYRLFSINLGLLIGYIHSAYYSLISIKVKKSFIKEIIYFSYLIIFIYLMITIGDKTKYLKEYMIIISLITCRLIDYGTIIESKDNVFNKIIKFISSNTYEIYLVQYPVIFLMQELNLKKDIKVLLTVIITILISVILKGLLHTKIKKYKVITWIFRIPIFIICIYGLFQFVIAKDHTKEMKALEQELLKNEEIMKEEQDKYKKRMQEEQDSWKKKLEEFLKNEETLKDTIRNMNIIGVGDSVMLGAIPGLKEQFPNGYFDAGVSRTDWEANNILLSMKRENILGEPVLINLGTNGQCGDECRKEILGTVENRKVFWVNVTNDYEVHVNKSIEEFANTNSNVYMIDWNSASINHREYFVADGIHLTSSGIKAYSEVIFNSIYDTYLNEFKKEKEKILKEQENSLKNGISFFGNDLLLNIFQELNLSNNNEFNIDSNYTMNKLLNEIEIKKNNDTLKNKIFLIFDTSINLKESDYNKIISYLDNKEIYIIEMTKLNISKSNKNVLEIPFYKEMEDDYISPDKIHLTKKGNQKLKELIESTIKNVNFNAN